MAGGASLDGPVGAQPSGAADRAAQGRENGWSGIIRGLPRCNAWHSIGGTARACTSRATIRRHSARASSLSGSDGGQVRYEMVHLPENREAAPTAAVPAILGGFQGDWFTAAERIDPGQPTRHGRAKAASHPVSRRIGPWKRACGSGTGAARPMCWSRPCLGEGAGFAGAGVLALVAWLCLRHGLSGIPAAARGRGVLYECPGAGAPEERARDCLYEPAAVGDDDGKLETGRSRKVCRQGSRRHGAPGGLQHLYQTALRVHVHGHAVLEEQIRRSGGGSVPEAGRGRNLYGPGL